MIEIVPDRDLCNMALLRLGTRSTILSLDEGSSEAEACKAYYRPCLLSLLGTPQSQQGGAVHNWHWCRADEALTPDRSTVPDWCWQAPLPDDCVKPVALQDDCSGFSPMGVFPDRGGKSFRPRHNFTTGLSKGQTILRFNSPHPVLSYISASVPVSSWPAPFIEAFTAHLAARLSITLTGNGDIAAQMKMDAETLTQYAVQNDQSIETLSTSYVPDWVAGRGHDGEDGFSDPEGYVAFWGLGHYHDPNPPRQPAGLEVVRTELPVFYAAGSDVLSLPEQSDKTPARYASLENDWRVGSLAIEKTPLGYQRKHHKSVTEPNQ